MRLIPFWEWTFNWVLDILSFSLTIGKLKFKLTITLVLQTRPPPRWNPFWWGEGVFKLRGCVNEESLINCRSYNHQIERIFSCIISRPGSMLIDKIRKAFSSKTDTSWFSVGSTILPLCWRTAGFTILSLPNHSWPELLHYIFCFAQSGEFLRWKEINTHTHARTHTCTHTHTNTHTHTHTHIHTQTHQLIK